ncbi:hypothetical protein [Tepidibacillus sp. LV47]|uniref:hypothetical protein n=1 Tax=Tepidibacillus sp. LV47 TaxID=3398228 RepID=UPI003AAB0465
MVKLNNEWTGIPVLEVMKQVKIKPEVKYDGLDRCMVPYGKSKDTEMIDNE